MIVRSLYVLFRRHKYLGRLTAENPHLAFNRYLRLGVITLVQMTYTIFISVFTLTYLVTKVMVPYEGFKAQHAHYSHVSMYPLDTWLDPQSGFTHKRAIIETLEWLFIGSSFSFFFLFCFSEHARAKCRKMYGRIKAWVSSSKSRNEGVQDNVDLEAGGMFTVLQYRWTKIKITDFG